MKIQLKFKNIVDTPKCKIFLGDQELYSGVVPPDYDRICELAEGDCQLIVEHFDKLPSDTIVENGAIVRDRSFELDKIIIDDYDLEELIWNSEFLAEDGSVYPSCLFFGPNGKFVLNFHNPILYWILKTRHEKNNNDPTWEEDYNYYQRACKILAQM
jgi:hypothetical protein